MIYFKPLVFLLVLFSCNKNKPIKSGNIWLKDKPLNEIKAAIQGKWQLHYSYGGITGSIRQNHRNSFLEFKANDSVYWAEDNSLIVADMLTWKRKRDMVGDTTYIMTFCEMRGPVCYPFSWGVQNIRNDTLVLYDDADDPMAHYLTKK